MRLSDFHYDLPAERIAQRPLAERSASRLLVIDGRGGGIEDRVFGELPELLEPGDLLVFNDTRVVPARLRGRKRGSGGRVEVLVERMLADDRRAWCHVRASKTPRPGVVLELGDGRLAAAVIERSGDLFLLDFGSGEPLIDRLEELGEMPLPPYIDRPADADDRGRYQTVFAREPGAVAAPTAGLHFDARLLQRLAECGVETTHVTLHVGAGTFQPVRSEVIEAHRMHAERIDVPDTACAAIAATRARGGRVVAVGTTVVRSLESAAGSDGDVRPWRGETELFLTPGARFRVVDGLITNFHLPGSTLLMLVCAFGGYERVMAAYRHAVDSHYRFFSYGDACLVWPDPEARAQ